MAEFFKFTDNGIEFSGFQDIRAALKDDWKAVFGDAIDLSETSPDGHHVDLEAKTISSVSEGLQVLTTFMNRNQAKGQFLDFLAAFLRLHRAEGESDASLLQRMETANVEGLATPDGMITYLRDKIGPSVGVTFNYQSSEVDGVPPHSFKVTVPSTIEKSDAEIGAAIWACNPAGIGSCGNHRVGVTDAAGKPQQVFYSRPVDVLVDVEIQIVRYLEEAFPANGEELVKQRILEWANGTGSYGSAEFKPGTDVIPSRFFFPMLSVPGIQDAVIKVRKSGGEFASKVISINPEETVVLDNISVSVTNG